MFHAATKLLWYSYQVVENNYHISLIQLSIWIVESSYRIIASDEPDYFNTAAGFTKSNDQII
jgi:hypothetical protein